MLCCQNDWTELKASPRVDKNASFDELKISKKKPECLFRCLFQYDVSGWDSVVLLDVVVNVWNCGGGESNLCCQVGTVPVVLVGGLAYRTLWSTKILSSCFSPCLWRDLRVSVGPRLWNDCEVFVSLFSTFSSVMHCAFKMYLILSKLLILLLILCIQLFLLNHCRQSSTLSQGPLLPPH